MTDEHGAARAGDHGRRNAAQSSSAGSSEPSEAEHDRLGVELIRRLADHFLRFSTDTDQIHLDRAIIVFLGLA